MSDVAYASIGEIHNLYREKRLSVRELVLTFLTRIAAIDKCEGGLNSVLEINPDALYIADAYDAMLRAGAELTPLFGIPVLLKDNVNTGDGMHTSAGSVALAGNYAPRDAHIVKLLRDAGAVILGKANMTEFANYMSNDNMPSGYSSRGGQVINPYNRDVTPSGSSSGSAVAAAAGLCTVSIGTETCGSIISPAGYNGIVGVKPTLGLVGRSGIVPIAHTLDTAGPMARSVRDAAILLGVIAGRDPGDPATHSAPADDMQASSRESFASDCEPRRYAGDPPIQNGAAYYTGCLDPDGLKGARIGVYRWRERDGNFTPDDETRAAFDDLLRLLANAGAVLVDGLDIGEHNGIGDIMRYEFKADMNRYLSALNGNTKMKTLGDIVAYNQANAAVALKYGQGILADAENNTSGNMTEPAYIAALMERERAAAALDGLFVENRINVLLCEAFVSVAPFAGFPTATIPTGLRRDKRPADSYWVARRYGEAALLKITYAAEQILNIRIRPDI